MTGPGQRTIAGIILAGGRSRRMGGGDKALLDLAGQPMLAHVIKRFAPQVAALALNANGDPARFSTFRLPVIPDPVDGYPGPLAGVLAGLVWARSALPGVTHVASVPADVPLLPRDVVRRLADGLAAGAHPIALARSRGRPHPVVGLWPVALAGDLETALTSGARKVADWADLHGVAAVDFEDEARADGLEDPFFNANTPDDLARLRRHLSAGISPAPTEPAGRT